MFLRILSILGHSITRYISIKIYISFIILACSFHVSHAQPNNITVQTANTYKANITAIKPAFNKKLNNEVHETSGLLWWNNQLWTHNDSGGEPALYAVDTATGDVSRKVIITNATNVDWEDITQDNNFIYIGDFGNNAHGNRQNLKIYKVKKSDVKTKDAVEATVINFSYGDQTNFAATHGNSTDFDCEAFVAYNDSLYLFSKDWIDNKTRLYKLPKTPGTYTAAKIGRLNVNGMITGATMIAGKKVIVLTGYSELMMPFIYVLYDFNGNHFFNADKQKISIKEDFLQVEGICPISDTSFYITNERLNKIIYKPAMLQTINLGALLNPYYAKLPSKTTTVAKQTVAHSFKKKGLPDYR